MNSKSPHVVLVYTQNEWIPDGAFQLSSIPLALASYFKYGKPSFAALPANTLNIKIAFSSARFLVIGTHGWQGAILSDDGEWIAPADTTFLQMETIYFGSCYFGARRNEWQHVFPNARLLGHDSLTYPLIGWLYLVFKSWIDLMKINSN